MEEIETNCKESDSGIGFACEVKVDGKPIGVIQSEMGDDNFSMKVKGEKLIKLMEQNSK